MPVYVTSRYQPCSIPLPEDKVFAVIKGATFSQYYIKAMKFCSTHKIDQ